MRLFHFFPTIVFLSRISFVSLYVTHICANEDESGEYVRTKMSENWQNVLFNFTNEELNLIISLLVCINLQF